MQEVSRRADILRFVCTNAMLAKTRDSASRVDTNKRGHACTFRVRNGTASNVFVYHKYRELVRVRPETL